MDEVLDLKGLKCPMPALFAKRAMLRVPRGALIEIVSDDPLAALDIPHMCHQDGFEVVSLRRDGDLARMVLRRP